MVDDGLEQGLHGHSRAAEVQRRDSAFSGCENKRAVQLIVVRAKVHQKFENFIDDLCRTRTRAVDLVDADND